MEKMTKALLEYCEGQILPLYWPTIRPTGRSMSIR